MKYFWYPEQFLTISTLQVIDLEKKISELDGKIKESQQFWLRLQSMVVTLSEKRAQQMDEIFVGRKRELRNFIFLPSC